MFLSPVTAKNYSFAFSSPAVSNPSKFFPGLEAPADTLLAARADEELSRRIAARLEVEMGDAIGEWRHSGQAQRAMRRRAACRTLREYREARARAHAARKVLFKMLCRVTREEIAA